MGPILEYFLNVHRYSQGIKEFFAVDIGAVVQFLTKYATSAEEIHVGIGTPIRRLR